MTIEAQGPRRLARANHDLTAYDFGFTVGLAAAGATIGTVANTGSTSAYLDYRMPSSARSGRRADRDRDLGHPRHDEHADHRRRRSSTCGTTRATTTITPTIEAYIGQNDTSSTSQATSTSPRPPRWPRGTPTPSPTAAAAIDIAAGVSQVTTSPVVKGYIDQGSHGHRRRRHQRHLHRRRPGPTPVHATRHVQSLHRPSTRRPAPSRTPVTWAMARKSSTRPMRHRHADRRSRQQPDHVERQCVFAADRPRLQDRPDRRQ